MSKRNWSSLVRSTALATCIAGSAFAGESFMIQLKPPAVDAQPSEPAMVPPAETITQSTTSSAVEIKKDPQIKPLPVIGSTGADTAVPAALNVKSGAPQIAPADASAPPAEAPSSAAIESAKPQSDQKVITADPIPAAAPVAPNATLATTPVQSEPTAVTAAPLTATSAPATDAVAKPVEAAAMPATSKPAPVAAGSLPAVIPAPLTTAATTSTEPTAPIAATPVTTPTPAALTAEVLASAVKTEIETHLTGKPADDKRLSSEEKKAHAAVLAFYAGRSYLPLWVDVSGFTHAADSAVERLKRAQDDGLNPADYPVPTLSGDRTTEALAKAEWQLTESTMKYARQAQAGRFDPGKLGELVTAKPTIPDPDGVLKTLAGSNDVSAALEAFNPPQEGYKRLKAKLAEISMDKPIVAQARLPGGPTIRPGEKDTRVALLRNRLGVNGAATADDAAIYDDSLVEAVKSFQKTRGLKPSGLIGQQTIDAMNDLVSGPDTRVADIIANMERWRWLPRTLGDLYVMVNIPDFSLTVVRDGVVTHKAKAIVGRVANPTPVFSETMTHIIVNPYWNVPYSIVKKEYLGKAQETRGEALTRGNFEVEVGNKTVDPTSVDWSTVNASEIHLRQRPGEGNALGNIKFMFPNQHSVYIHDTSSRGLFVQSYRSLSHGCVRVQDPFSFADALLAAEPTGITGAKLKAMIGGDEKYLWLKKTIPVHIAYFTDFIDDAGVLQTRPDLYGHNAKTKQLLGL